MTGARLWALLAAGLLSCLAREAGAQVSAIDEPAISVERLWLEPGPGTFIAAQDARLAEPGSWSLAVLGSLMRRPIVLRDLQTGEEASVPVDVRLGYELAFARGMSERLQLGVALPLIAAQDGERLQGIGLSEESLAAVAVGDLRLHGKLRLQENEGSPLAYGLAFHLALPTGNEEHFAGERGTVLAWTLIAAYRGSAFRVAANLGLRLRTEEVVLLSPARPHGNELSLLLAGEYRLPGAPLAILAELSQVRGDEGGPSPGEARGGVAAQILPRARLKLLTGRGFTPDEVGAPEWRVAAVFEYQGR